MENEVIQAIVATIRKDILSNRAFISDILKGIELKEENYRAPVTKQNNYGQNNARQTTRKYMNRNYRDDGVDRRTRRRR